MPVPADPWFQRESSYKRSLTAARVACRLCVRVFETVPQYMLPNVLYTDDLNTVVFRAGIKSLVPSLVLELYEHK